MTERQLEPTPGWCERARKLLACDELMPSGAELCLEYDRAAKPAPLPHEFTARSPINCIHCAKPIYLKHTDDPCPARNKPEPAAKGAELPDGLESLPDAIVDAADNMFDKDPVAMVSALHFANAILAEVDRRIEAAVVKHDEAIATWGGIKMREIADERIGKARVFIKIQNRYSRTYDIVPGDKA